MQVGDDTTATTQFANMMGSVQVVAKNSNMGTYQRESPSRSAGRQLV